MQNLIKQAEKNRYHIAIRQEDRVWLFKKIGLMLDLLKLMTYYPNVN